MTDELTIDGEQFISSKRASESSGYEQDYIGQLCRGGIIKSRRVGGLWYVSFDSLTKYKQRADEYKPEPPVRDDLKNHPDTLLSFDGKGFVSAARASKITGYTADYVGQMARAGTIPSRQVGNRWYVDQEEVIRHKDEKDRLLAAVQSQSVGFKPQITPETGKNGAEHFPLLQYVRDDREPLPTILPSINEKSANAHVNESERRVIPIRKYHDKAEIPEDEEIENPVSLEVRRSMLPILLPVGLFTIVIVLSLGFVSLKRSSTYTTSDGKSNSEQLASARTALLHRVGDVLEEWLVPELTYKQTR